MSPSIKQKKAIPVFLVALVLACFAISRSVQAAEFNTPFQRAFGMRLDPGQSGGADQIPIPAGKTLVVEFVSASTELPAGEQPILIIEQNLNAWVDLLLNFAVSYHNLTLGSRDVFITSQQIRLYATGNITIGFIRDVTKGEASTSGHVIGYLVDTP
jgi:hypothetical protein